MPFLATNGDYSRHKRDKLSPFQPPIVAIPSDYSRLPFRTTIVAEKRKQIVGLRTAKTIRFKISNNKPTIRFEMENHYLHSTTFFRHSFL